MTIPVYCLWVMERCPLSYVFILCSYPWFCFVNKACEVDKKEFQIQFKTCIPVDVVQALVGRRYTLQNFLYHLHVFFYDDYILHGLIGRWQSLENV